MASLGWTEQEAEEVIDARAEVTMDKAMSVMLEAVAAVGINPDSRTRGYGEDFLPPH